MKLLFRILSYPFVLIKLIAIALLASVFAAYDELFVLPKYFKK